MVSFENLPSDVRHQILMRVTFLDKKNIGRAYPKWREEVDYQLREFI